MTHWRRRLVFLLSILLFIILLGAVLSVYWRDFLVDLWWFDSLGYGLYFWQRLLYRYAVFAAVTLAFFGIFFLNFLVASRFLHASRLISEAGNVSERRRIMNIVWEFRRGSLFLYTPLSAVLGIVIAFPLLRHWQEFLFYVFGSQSGVSDPVYGKDVSFYLFSYPIYTLLEHRLVIAFVVLLCGLVIMYGFERRLLAESGRKLSRGARWHLSLIVLLVFGLEIWGFVLRRYGLLYSENHLPRFFGPGFVEMRYVLPMIWLALLSLAGVAVSLTIYINVRKGLVATCVSVGLFIIFLIGLHSSAINGLINRYLVTPNEMSREWKYMEYNIKATLTAYKLSNVEIRDFSRQRRPEEETIPHVRNLLSNVPVWDREQLQDVYKQLQELRTYYSFNTVNVGRYMVDGGKKQVFLSARELDYAHLPGQTGNWVNQHLSYTHGYGAVMTPASQQGGRPMTWYLSGIPPQSDFGFFTKQPGIYYGLGSYHYVIAPNTAREIDYPERNDNALADYTGGGGVSISSLWRRLVFAFYFSDRNIFFTTKIKSESRILFRRNLRERVHLLTPYLVLDRAPYLVVTPTRLLWIQDAYTTASSYPSAMTSTLYGEQINYLRNSVKIVMDAYSGGLTYYIADPEDPIIRAYTRMYPGVFKPLSQMPSDIRPHIRYPQDMFDTQMSIYAKYHQTDPAVFYQAEDVWQPAAIPGMPESSADRAHYATLDLIQPSRLDFLLLLPMLPLNRNNLRALAVGGCDGEDYGRLIVYQFPKGELVFGPSQVDSLINENTDIAKDFTLWDQAGSRVARGQMIVLPVGNTVFYIQPVYLQARRLNIPELQRVIMSQGQTVVMATSLEEAYERLTKLTQELGAEKSRTPGTPLQTPIGNAEAQPASSQPSTGGAETQPVPTQTPAGGEKTQPAPSTPPKPR